MIAEVFESESISEECYFCELFGFLLVQGGLGFLDQGEHVAHAEDAADDAVRMKRLEGIGLFTGSDDLDGLAGDVADGERCTAARGAGRGGGGGGGGAGARGGGRRGGD